jgi:4-hydroxy-tetrahydrodipicolinate synthase
MARASEAREWAASALKGVGDSLYTPFSGPDGDEIDWHAYRQLVRYCAGTLGHPLLWLTSGLAEFWSLTIPERKRLLEVAIEEARAINPEVVIQACTAAMSARDCLELTLHAQEAGADMVYIQTPPMELHGGEGALRFFQYIAERTDIALGMFNSGSSGYMLSPQECLELYERIPAICAIKDGTFRPRLSRAMALAAPGLQVWECDDFALTSGWAAEGLVCKSVLGTAGYLRDYPGDNRYTRWLELLWQGRIDEALALQRDAADGPFNAAFSMWLTRYPGRPDYFTHWGEVIKAAAAALGLPIGDWPHSRPPQALLPEHAKRQIRETAEQAGILNIASKALAEMEKVAA